MKKTQGDTKSIAKNATIRVAMIAVMTALVCAGKQALAWIPNVEIVTLSLAIFGYLFGWAGVIAGVAFVAIEPLIWGFGGWWVYTYLCYWPFVPMVFLLLRKCGVKNVFLLTLVAVLMTAWFGVLDALIAVGLFGGKWEGFGERFGIYYARGIVFCLVQAGCNAALFLTAFTPLVRVLKPVAMRYGMYPKAFRGRDDDEQAVPIEPPDAD